jgi:xylulokinase
VIPSITVGAAYGAAYLAARAIVEADIRRWNPPAATVEPDPAATEDAEQLYALYRELYPATQDIVHALAARERSLS